MDGWQACACVCVLLCFLGVCERSLITASILICLYASFNVYNYCTLLNVSFFLSILVLFLFLCVCVSLLMYLHFAEDLRQVLCQRSVLIYV